jgi:hypothetical protein
LFWVWVVELNESLNIVKKHVFICSNPYIFTTAPEVDDVEGLAAAATKHLELLNGY